MVAQAERFTLLLDHALVNGRSSFTSRHMSSGQLVDDAGKRLDPCDDYPDGLCPPYVHVGVAGRYDIVPLASLLRAAGVTTLEQPSDAAADPHASLRHAGCVLMVHISYTNTRTASTAEFEYTVSVERVKGSEYKAVQRGDTRVNGTRENRHGIQLVVVFSGEVGSFDFQTLLVNLAGGAGLLAVGAVIVDFIALYVAPGELPCTAFHP